MNKPYALLLLCSSILAATQASVAQTILIDPAGDGGFEIGTSFAANGWTEVNPAAATRSWYIGTGPSGYSGSKAAFIGNSTTTVGTSSAARTVHFYRSVTFPIGATNIQLSFKYKQPLSDFAAPDTYYDYIAVYTSATAPVSGALPSGSILRFGPFPSASVAAFTTQNVTLPDSLAGKTLNLIFTFKADAITPHGYGAVDDISLSYTPGTPLPLAAVSADAVVQGASVRVRWSMTSEEQTASFIVGRSSDGSSFESLGAVLAVGEPAYTFTDTHPFAGQSFYRVQATAHDGTSAYSPTVFIRRSKDGKAGTITLAPQPASNLLLVHSNDESQNGSPVVVFDVQGKEVARFTLAPVTALDVSVWPPGPYALRLATGEVLRVVKQ